MSAEASGTTVEQSESTAPKNSAKTGAKNTHKNARPRTRSKKPKSESKSAADSEDEDSCIICANKIRYAAITPCNHTTCHMCTFRQRALYGKRQCLICRSENDKVIFTERIDATYEDFSAKDFVKYDAEHAVEFTQDYIYNDTIDLLSYKCVICHEKYDNFDQLAEHVKTHGKHYCHICASNKKAFISELALYSPKALQRHQVHGDGEESGFSGHPECKWCQRKRFYSIDELNVHIRDKHERCHICDQYNPKTADYYRNYDNLYNHFRRDHYVCTVPSCVEKRFVVFREDLDLTAHMLREHGGLGPVGSSKVVIGSNSRHFSSQLSTFQSRRFLEQNNDEEDHNSLDTKKRRFEERARHYLNYDSEKFQQFGEVNKLFKTRKVTARELFNQYSQIFKDKSIQDLNLLVKEFIEFFPASSDLHKDLLPIVKELQLSGDNEQFPVLGGSSSASNTASWVKSKSSSTEKFPALKPSKKPATPPLKSQPIRYTTVTKKTSARTVVKTSSAPSNYIPNYLNNLPKNQPVLGSRSSSPDVTKASWSRSGTHTNGGATSSSSTSSPQLPDTKFPALEKKSNKKVIPRVNPVNVPDPSQWGKVEEDEPVFLENDIIQDKRQRKSKKKQDRLLFST